MDWLQASLRDAPLRATGPWAEAHGYLQPSRYATAAHPIEIRRVQLTAVPEPSLIALGALGLGALLLRRRK